MKFAKYSFLLFLPLIVFANTETLNEVTETIRTKPTMEALRLATTGNLVPRTSGGVACSGCADLGTSDYKWGGIFINPDGANGGLRQYAGYFPLEFTRNLSVTYSSSTFGGRELIPSASFISNPNKKPLLISFSCDNGSNNRVTVTGTTKVLWIRLGRKTGTVEEHLQTFVFKPSYTGGNGGYNTFYPSSSMMYVDADPPSLDFQYFIEGAVVTVSGTTTSSLASCVQVVSL